MALTATGIGSGLDIEALVTKLMEAERVPKEQRLLTSEVAVTSSISGLGSLKSALSGLQATLASANSLSTFNQRNASSSDSTAVAVSASSSASLGTYSATVQSLASQQSLAVRDTFSSIDEVVGTGTLTFTFGTTAYTAHATDNLNDTYGGFTAKAGVASQTVTIDSTNNTLAGVRDAINNANAGITAAVVNSGNSYRLLISSDSTGAENSVQISVTDAGDGNNTDSAGLSRLAFNSQALVGNVYQTVAAKDAAFTLNGLSLSSASNTVTSVVDGLTMTLKDTTSSSVSLTVADNKAGIKAALTAFVEGYNSYMDTLDDLTGYDFALKKGGALQGDFSALSTAAQVRQALGAAVSGYSGTYTRLAEIGISTLSSGKLSIDDTKLDAALASDFTNVAAVVTRYGRVSQGSGVSDVSFTSAAAVGDYTVAVSSMATNGSVLGAALSVPLTIGSSNDTFSITVDGTASGDITLSNQEYTSLASLVSELQTKINADTSLRAAGKGATVSSVDGKLKIASNTPGSSSTVTLSNGTGDSTLTALGLNAATAAVGTDLVGTINGVAGVASGNVLSGAAGSDSVGLSVAVRSTSGGTVSISQGVIDQLDKLLTSLLGTDDALNSRITSLEARITDIEDERAALEVKLAATEARFRREFNSLDALVNQLTSTGSFVSAQLANIPIPGKSSK
jgi:flagellar hook-associated protein 2